MTRVIKLIALSCVLTIVAGCGVKPNAIEQKEKAENEIVAEESETKLLELQKQNELLRQEIEELKSELAESTTGQEIEKELTKSSDNSPEEISVVQKKEVELPKTEEIVSTEVNNPVEETEDKGRIFGGLLANYNVEVMNKTIQAVYTVGEYTKDGAFYQFYSSSDELLGRLPDSEVGKAVMFYNLSDLSDDEHFEWFTQQFNLYRGVEATEESTSERKADQVPVTEIPSKDSFIDTLVTLTNEERRKYDLEPLMPDPIAMEYAKIRAKELELNFAHTDMAYKNCSFAENIAKGYKTPQAAINGWMDSPGHRDAILNDYSDYGNRFGVGCFIGSDGKYYWVQEFILWDEQF